MERSLNYVLRKSKLLDPGFVFSGYKRNLCDHRPESALKTKLVFEIYQPLIKGAFSFSALERDYESRMCADAEDEFRDFIANLTVVLGFSIKFKFYALDDKNPESKFPQKMTHTKSPQKNSKILSVKSKDSLVMAYQSRITIKSAVLICGLSRALCTFVLR